MAPLISIDTSEGETALADVSSQGKDTVTAFDALWAKTVLRTARERLEQEQAAAGQGQVFRGAAPLRDAAPAASGDYERMAAALGMRLQEDRGHDPPALAPVRRADPRGSRRNPVGPGRARGRAAAPAAPEFRLTPCPVARAARPSTAIPPRRGAQGARSSVRWRGAPFPLRAVPRVLSCSVEAMNSSHELGRGSMGVVWLARERALDRLVALKVAAPGADPAWSARLLREGKAVASLDHLEHRRRMRAGRRGALRVSLDGNSSRSEAFDARTAEGPLPLQGVGPYPPWRSWPARSPTPTPPASPTCEHRSPRTTPMGDNGEAAPGGLRASWPPSRGRATSLSPAHGPWTRAAPAPELLGGSDQAGPSSDIYGLGAVLYACLTRRAPFIGETVAAILAQLPASEPPPPHLLVPGVPRDLETICLKCMEKSPERRYASAALLQADLQAFIEGRPIAARPPGSAEKLARSCRRHPAPRGVGDVFGLSFFRGPRGPAARPRPCAWQRRGRARGGLRESLLARSRATRIAAQIGRRNDSRSPRPPRPP